MEKVLWISVRSDVKWSRMKAFMFSMSVQIEMKMSHTLLPMSHPSNYVVLFHSCHHTLGGCVLSSDEVEALIHWIVLWWLILESDARHSTATMTAVNIFLLTLSSSLVSRCEMYLDGGGQVSVTQGASFTISCRLDNFYEFCKFR